MNKDNTKEEPEKKTRGKGKSNDKSNLTKLINRGHKERAR
jgi:hypothetical protein